MGRPPAGAFDLATPERLLSAAEAEFARAGLAGARLEDIARQAGIRRPSLLYYFPTKEVLYARVVRRAFARLARALLGAMTHRGEFAERVEATAEALARSFRRDRALGPLILRELLDGHGPGRAILLEETVPLLDEVERFVRREGKGRLRPGLSVRSAILQGAADILLRSVSGALERPLWGTGRPWKPARLLLLKG